MLLLAIDPASISAAVALFEDGEFVASCRLLANKKDLWSVRLTEQRKQLEQFLNKRILFPNVIDTLVVEQIAGFGSAALTYSVGSLTSIGCIQSNLNLIVPSTWKSMCRRYGCKDKDPKGIKALASIRPDIKVVSDDEADAILIGLAYMEKGI